MRSLRPSKITTGRHTHLISKETEVQLILDVLRLTQDGGKSSDTKDVSLGTIKERYLTSKEMLMLKIETSLFTTLMEESTNNGISFMLMNGRVNLERENLTKSSVSMLKDHSML